MPHTFFPFYASGKKTCGTAFSLHASPRTSNPTVLGSSPGGRTTSSWGVPYIGARPVWVRPRVLGSGCRPDQRKTWSPQGPWLPANYDPPKIEGFAREHLSRISPGWLASSKSKFHCKNGPRDGLSVRSTGRISSGMNTRLHTRSAAIGAFALAGAMALVSATLPQDPKRDATLEALMALTAAQERQAIAWEALAEKGWPTPIHTTLTGDVPANLRVELSGSVDARVGNRGYNGVFKTSR